MPWYLRIKEDVDYLIVVSRNVLCCGFICCTCCLSGMTESVIFQIINIIIITIEISSQLFDSHVIA